MENFLLQKQNILLRQLWYILNLCPKFINYIGIGKYTVELHISRRYLSSFFSLLRRQWLLQYQSIVEITAIDFPSKKNRFRLAYSFLSYYYTNRLVLNINVNDTGTVESATPIFPGAGWLEREVWDFFGVFFKGNNDLRRILTDYGFLGHPLRKDFPLTGFYEVQYDDRKKQVIYRPVSLAQEFRNFRAVNVWNQSI